MAPKAGLRLAKDTAGLGSVHIFPLLVCDWLVLLCHCGLAFSVLALSWRWACSRVLVSDVGLDWVLEFSFFMFSATRTAQTMASRQA